MNEKYDWKSYNFLKQKVDLSKEKEKIIYNFGVQEIHHFENLNKSQLNNTYIYIVKRMY